MKELMTMTAEYDTEMDSLNVTVDCWDGATRIDVMMRVLAVIDTAVETIADSEEEYDTLCEMMGYLVSNLPEIGGQLKNTGCAKEMQ